MSGLEGNGPRSWRLHGTVDNLVLEDEARPRHHGWRSSHGHQLRSGGRSWQLRRSLLRSEDASTVLDYAGSAHPHKLIKLRLSIPDPDQLLLLLWLLWARLGVDDRLATD